MNKSIFDDMSEEEFVRFAVDCGVECEGLGATQPQNNIELKEEERKIIKTKGKVIGCYRADEHLADEAEDQQENISLTQDEIIFLKNLVIKLKSKNGIGYTKGEIITRSIRVDKTAMETFAEYCDKMGIKQVHALSQALIDFVDK